MIKDAQEQLRNLVVDESRTWVEVADVVVCGRAHREILRAAETKASDLIVMGAQGRGGVGLALFGSTTQEVTRGATCPVLHGARAGANLGRGDDGLTDGRHVGPRSRRSRSVS